MATFFIPLTISKSVLYVVYKILFVKLYGIILKYISYMCINLSIFMINDATIIFSFLYTSMIMISKRFYTRATLRNIWILRFAKIPTLYGDSWIKKIVIYLSCIEGAWKTVTVVHEMPRYLLIYHKISFMISYSCLNFLIQHTSIGYCNLIEKFITFELSL